MNQSDFTDALKDEKGHEASKGASDALDELADLIELNGAKGPDKFKVKQYRAAAETLRQYKGDVSKLTKPELMSIKGIGDSISNKVLEFIQTGKISKAEKLRASTPPVTIHQFTKLRKVGPAGAKKIWETYNVATLDDLIKLIDAGKITDKSLIESVQFYKTSSERILLSEALAIIQPIVESLSMFTEVKKIAYTGSLARKKDTVHDADILILTSVTAVPKIVKDFIKFADEVTVQGDTKTTIYVQHFQIDLTVITNEKEFGGALFHACGPKEYNIRNRQKAIEKGWLLNDKGLWEGNKQLDDGTEESICEKLGIKWIPPELRELAAFTEVPDNVVNEVEHDFHIHTTFSDGHNSVEEIVNMAMQFKLKSIAITDHGAGMPMIAVKDLKEYFRAIKTVQGNVVDVKIGIEANINKEGELDYTKDELKHFDIVVASIHSGFDMEKEEQTQRLLKVINGHDEIRQLIIGHPTTEDYGTRGPIDVDWERIFKACTDHEVVLEINALPTRIGLSIELMRRAKELGVMFSLGSDSHFYTSDALTLALWRARRAGLTKGDLI